MEPRTDTRRPRIPKVAVAAGLTAFLAMAGAGLAFAVDGGGSSSAGAGHLAATTSGSSTGSSPSGEGSSSGEGSGEGNGGGSKAGQSGGPGGHRGGFGAGRAAGFGGGFGLAGFGMGGLVHGQGVVKDGSTYKTVDVQTGTVKSVSSTSIVVSSSDGFSATYVVDPSTVVDSQAGGISTVAKNDTVEVVALVSGQTATATTIVDSTKISSSRKGFGFGDQGHPGQGPGRPAQAPSGQA